MLSEASAAMEDPHPIRRTLSRSTPTDNDPKHRKGHGMLLPCSSVARKLVKTFNIRERPRCRLRRVLQSNHRQKVGGEVEHILKLYHQDETVDGLLSSHCSTTPTFSLPSNRDGEHKPKLIVVRVCDPSVSDRKRRRSPARLVSRGQPERRAK